MKLMLLAVTILLLMSKCTIQGQGVEVKKVFELYVYQKGCKIYAPQYSFKDKYYVYDENVYTFKEGNWCAVKENLKKIDLPEPAFNLDDRNEFDYRILNDSIAVFFFDKFYQILYYINFKNGARIKSDTLIENITYSIKTNSKNYKQPKYEFTGGAFVSDKLYFLSVRNNRTQKSTLFQIALSDQKVDTIHTTFSFENYIQTVKSSDKYLMVDDDVLNISTKEHKTLKSEIDSKYRLLDFVNNDIVMLHHSKEPHKFALLNVTNGRSELFELDKTIFKLENIREEEVLKVEDGPSDGLNKLKFKYFTCRTGENIILISFTDRKDNRIVYSLEFKEDILRRLN